MPAKGKRVASRQAQLNRRRRRQARAGAEMPVRTVEVDGAQGGGVPASASPTATATVAATGVAPNAEAQLPTTAAQETERSRTPGRSALPMAYGHLAAEFKRITIMAGIVTIALVAISFVI